MRVTAFLFVVLLLAGTLLPGCGKEQFLDAYDSVVQTVGSLGLTSDLTLQGRRTFGADQYTGTYTADLVNFTGEETLFGGTALTWRSKEALTVTCTLTVQSGDAALIWNCGADQPVTVADGPGDWSRTIYLAPGSNYFSLACQDFTGSVELTIQ